VLAYFRFDYEKAPIETNDQLPDQKKNKSEAHYTVLEK